MNICVLDYDINPPWVEAVRILAYELSLQLIKEGHSVHVITSGGPTLPSEEEIDGIMFHRISKRPFLSYLLARKAKKLHKRYSFDLIHVQNSLMKKSFMVTLMLLKKWVRVPILGYICLQPMTSPTELIQLLRIGKTSQDFSRIAGWLVGALTPNYLVKKEFSMVDRIVTSSNYLKTALVRLGIEPNKIDTIYPFTNIQEFAEDSDYTDFRENLGVTKDVPLILYVGSTEPARLGSFLKAIPIVLREIPETKVVLVSSYSKRFFDLVGELGLEHAFILLPQNVEIKMSRLMAASDVFVYPGFSGIVSVDPPLTIIEAMVLGVPIVTNNTGGISEIIGDYKNCFFVETSDHEGMANTLSEILRKTNFSSRSGRRLKAANSQNRFESKFAAGRFISIYEHLTRNRMHGQMLNA